MNTKWSLNNSIPVTCCRTKYQHALPWIAASHRLIHRSNKWNRKQVHSNLVRGGITVISWCNYSSPFARWQQQFAIACFVCAVRPQISPSTDRPCYGEREMTKTAQNQNGPTNVKNGPREDQNGPHRGPKWPRRKQKWPKWPKSKMAYDDVKNVIIDKFSQILAVLVIKDVQKQIFFTKFKILFIS